MRRDRTLQRLLLLQVRDGKEPAELNAYSEGDKLYNSALLIDEGLVDGQAIPGSSGQIVSTVIRDLTSRGHDFLERTERNPQLEQSPKGSLAPPVPPTQDRSPTPQSDASPNEQNLQSKQPPSQAEAPKANESASASDASKSIEPPPAFGVGKLLNFSRVADIAEIALNVDGYARVLARLLQSSDDKDLCLGIFGPWGRGKTFLIDQLIERLGSDSGYQVVKFSAWKYPSRPEVWIHLFESFYRSLTNRAGRFRSLAPTILAGIKKHGTFPFWLGWFLLMLTAIPKGNILKEMFNYLRGFDGVVAAVSVAFLLIFLFEFWNTLSHLRRRYISRTNHQEKLGLQETIGRDLEALLAGWVQVNFASKRIRGGMIRLWLAAILLIGFITWRSYEVPAITIILGVVVLLVPLGVTLMFHFHAISPKKLLLVVDDLDRCQFDHLLAVMESIKLLLENEEIGKRVQVIMLIEEDVLKHAIIEKYKPLTDKEIQNSLGTSFDAKRIVRENQEKLFTAHLRLASLTDEDVAEMISKFGKDFPELKGGEPSEYEGSTKRDVKPHEAPRSSITHRLDSTAAITDEEKAVILLAIANSRGKAGTEFGPRSIRAILFRYQLARLILDELYEKNWSPALLARLIVNRISEGTIDFREYRDKEKLLPIVAEQVA